jgi:predicted secreted protein
VNRSKKIIVVCHCLLNANAKVSPLAVYPGVLRQVMDAFIESGTGIIQLPCPETSYLGLNRWGMCFEQYNHPNYRRHCRRILESSVDQIEAFSSAGYEICGIIGAEGSPNCGVTKIPSGLTGGVIRDRKMVESQLKAFTYKQGSGVFLSELKSMLKDNGISAKLMAVDEKNPSTLIRLEKEN